MPHVILLPDTDVLRAGSRILWILIAAMAAATAVTLWAMGLSVTWKIFPYVPSLIVLCGAVTLFYRFFRPDPAIFYATELTTQILLIILLGQLLAYGAAALGLPYRDAELLAADRWLGFDLQRYLSFVDSRPWLALLNLIAYASMGWQTPIVFFVLLLTRRVERLQDFAMSVIVSLVITISIFALFPALGWFGYLHIEPATFPNLTFLARFVSHLEGVRSGTLRAIPVDDVQGVISFPSYHAAAAVLAVWALWPIRFFRLPLLILNSLMIGAAPIEGTHYFVDIIGGVAVSVCAVLAVGWIRQAIHHHRADSVSGPSIGERLAMVPD